MTAEPIIVLDERQDAETFVDKRPAKKDTKKDLAIELKEKGIEFDFGNMSYEDSMQMAMQSARTARMQMLGERVKMEDATPAMFDELLALSSPEAMDAVVAQIRGQMANIVKRLPRDWFVSSAPKDLNLDDPDTYKLLRADKANELRRLIARAIDEAKN